MPRLKQLKKEEIKKEGSEGKEGREGILEIEKLRNLEIVEDKEINPALTSARLNGSRSGGLPSEGRGINFSSFEEAAVPSDDGRARGRFFEAGAGNEEKGKNSFTIKVCDFLITMSFFLIFLGVPLFFTGLTWQGIAFEKQMFFYVFTLIGLFAWVLKAIQERRINIKRTPLDIPILIFITVALLASIFSINRWTSFFGGFGMPAKSFFSILAAALFYWLLVSNINKKRLAVIENALVISFTAVIILTILGFVSKYLGARTENAINSFFGGAGFNTIGLLSNLQIFISAAILILLGVIGAKKFGTAKKGAKFIEAFKKSFAFFTLFLCVVALFILGSYTSLIGLLAGLGIIIIFAIAGLFKIEKRAFGVISFLFALTLVYILIGKPALKLNNLPSEVGLSKSASWQISKEAFKARYILGTGPGNFEYAFNKYKLASFNNNILWSTRFSEATGIFYEILATMGGLGAASFALLIFAFLGVSISAILHKDKDGGTEMADDLVIVALFAASVSLGIDSLIYLTGGTLIIFAIIIAALAMAVISLNKKEYFKDLPLSYKVRPEYALALSFVFVCLCCGMVLIFISAGKIYLADIYAKEALVSSNEADAINKIQKSISLFPYQYMYYEKMGDLAGIAGAKNMSAGGENSDAQNLFVNALNSHKIAIGLSPENAFSWESLGVLAESFVQYDPRMLDDADASYIKAIALDPNNPALRVRLGVVREAKGDLAKNANQRKSESESTQKGAADKTQNADVAENLYNQAVENYKKASELKPDLTSAYDGLSRLEEKRGKLDDAIKNMTFSYRLNEKNSFYQFNLGRLYYNLAVLGDNANKRKLESESTQINNEETGAFDLGTATSTGEIATTTNMQIAEKPQVSEENKSKENDLKIAEMLFKQAIQTNPKYVDALYSLGSLYVVMGDKKQAKEYYKKSLDALPADSADSRKVIEDKMGKL